MTMPAPDASPTTLDPLLATVPADVVRRIRPLPALAAVYRMLLRNQATKGRLAVVTALGALVAVISPLVAHRHGYDALENGTRYLNSIGLTLLVPVVSLVFASAALGDLVDDDSLVYLWLPPVPRWVIAAAAYFSTVTICLPMVAVPLTIAAVLSGGGSYLIEGTAVSSGFGVIAYSGLFTALGLRFRRSLLWGLAYLLLWETFIANVAAGPARVSVLSYERSLLSAYTGVGLKLADRSIVLAYLVPIVLAIVAVAYTARRLARQDIA